MRRSLLQPKFSAASRPVDSGSAAPSQRTHPARPSVLLQLKTHMPALDQPHRSPQRHSARHQHRLSIPNPKRPTSRHPVTKLRRQLIQSDLSITLQRRFQHLLRQLRLAIPLHPLPQQPHLARQQRKSHRMSMPAKPRKQQIICDRLMHRRQRIQQMKARNRPPRPMRLPILMRQHQRRPARPVHHPRSQESPARRDATPRSSSTMHSRRNAPSPHPASPPTAPQSPPAPSASVALRSSFSAIQLLRQFLAPRRVLRQKQLHDIARHIHPPRSIDPRSQPEPHLRRRRRRDSAAICATSIRARSPGCTGFRSVAQPQRRNHPVLTLQRHRIRNRRNRHQLQKRGKCPTSQLLPLPHPLAAAMQESHAPA